MDSIDRQHLASLARAMAEWDPLLVLIRETEELGLYDFEFQDKGKDAVESVVDGLVDGVVDGLVED